MDNNVEVTLITCPAGDAEAIAIALVEKHLAACVNILPGVSSVYRWEGKVEQTMESLLIVKSGAGSREALVSRVLEMHPYSCPEIITISVSAGSKAYLDWVVEQTRAGTEGGG